LRSSHYVSHLPFGCGLFRNMGHMQNAWAMNERPDPDDLTPLLRRLPKHAKRREEHDKWNALAIFALLMAAGFGMIISLWLAKQLL
jgi:hypothetical protein